MHKNKYKDLKEKMKLYRFECHAFDLFSSFWTEQEGAEWKELDRTDIWIGANQSDASWNQNVSFGLCLRFLDSEYSHNPSP